MYIFSSIPPVLRGQALVDAPEQAFQREIIQSWMASGFTPVSLNTPPEIDAQSGLRESLAALGVGSLVVDPSPNNYPSHLPNLCSSLKVIAARYPNEPVALTNADIHISLDERTSERINTLGVGEFLLSHRVDVPERKSLQVALRERSQEESFRPYRLGLDFVAARAELLIKALPFLSPSLTFGLPWWDLLLPMALMARGAVPHHLDRLQFLHLAHPDRWDVEHWDRIGVEATRHLYRKIDRSNAPAPACRWAQGYARLTSPLQHPRIALQRAWQRWMYIKEGRRCPSYLLELARLTRSVVLEADNP